MVGKNMLVLTYWSYPDALIQTYTLPYLHIIQKKLPPNSRIYLVTLEKERSYMKGLKREEISKGLHSAGIEWLPFVYKPFGASAFILWIGIFFTLCSLIVKRKISVIHSWCTPPGAIGYFLSLLLNRKLILDSYEPHAEAMVENGTWKKSSIAFRLLFWLERKQTERASYVISATAGMHDYARQKYSVSIKKFYVKPACVDLDLFSIDQIKNKGLLHDLHLYEKIVCVYAGKFGGIYLDKEVFLFFKEAHQFWGDAFRVLLLTSQSNEEIRNLCLSVNLDEKIIIKRFVLHHEIPKYVGLGDFAITPVKPVPSKRYCTPIKDGEYWALGLPVIIPAGISDDAGIIKENNIGFVLEALNNSQFLQAIKRMDQMLKLPKGERIESIRAIAEKYRSFKIAEDVYEAVYKQVFN